jgi:hypothetical protein
MNAAVAVTILTATMESHMLHCASADVKATHVTTGNSSGTPANQSSTYRDSPACTSRSAQVGRRYRVVVCCQLSRQLLRDPTHHVGKRAKAEAQVCTSRRSWRYVVRGSARAECVMFLDITWPVRGKAFLSRQREREDGVGSKTSVKRKRCDSLIGRWWQTPAL